MGTERTERVPVSAHFWSRRQSSSKGPRAGAGWRARPWPSSALSPAGGRGPSLCSPARGGHRGRRAGNRGVWQDQQGGTLPPQTCTQDIEASGPGLNSYTWRPPNTHAPISL